MTEIRRFSIVICSATLMLGCSSSDAPPPQADPQPGAEVVLSNGKILTVDDDFTIVEAVAIDGNRILATGSNEEILALADAGTEVVDLEGRTVVPGLIDNHVHFIRTVQRWHQQARIDGIASRCFRIS